MGGIVAGFDGSPSATAALTWAVSEARLREAELVALAILDEPPPPSAPAEAVASLGRSPDVVDDLRDAVHTIADDFPVVFRYSIGPAAARLIEAGAGADLLVVGSRGRNPVAGMLLGSVSRECLRGAPCPVVVVRPGITVRPAYGCVISGIDASEQSRQALVVAAQEARLRGAVLAAIHAVRRDRPGVGPIAPTNQQLLAEGSELVQTELAGAGVQARPVVVAGHAGEVLVSHSEHADLLVVGSSRSSESTTLPLGSISEFCARHADCPVMVVRSAGSAAE